MNIAACICSCNRTELIERLLNSLRAIDLGGRNPRDVTIIVVDNNPTGESRAVGESASDSLPVALHLVKEPKRGISFARNRAVSEAPNHGADFLACIDDDDLPQSVSGCATCWNGSARQTRTSLLGSSTHLVRPLCRRGWQNYRISLRRIRRCTVSNSGIITG